MLRTGRLRHRVDVKLPTTSLGSRGQRSGSDTLVVSDVPCEIVTLSGRELELARQTYPRASLLVTMWRPGLDITSQHYLQFGSRRLEIGAVVDEDQLGLKYLLTCGEAV